MPTNTPNLKLYKVDGETDGSDTFNVDVVLNDNWDKIDAAIKSVEDAVGDISIPDASLTKKGVTMLSNATDGTREDVAATEKAVGIVMKEALAGKQAGIDRKAEVVAALNSIGVTASTSESWAQLIPKIAAVIRATGDATAADVLADKKFSNISGNGLTGTMTNQGAKIITPSTTNQAIAGGYHNGSGYVKGDASLISGNLPKDITLFGVTGILERLTTADRNAIIAAIVGKGVAASSTDTNAQLAAKIDQINLGKAYFSASYPTNPNNSTTVYINCGFSYRILMCYATNNDGIVGITKSPTTSSVLSPYYGNASFTINNPTDSGVELRYGPNYGVRVLAFGV